MVDVSVMCKISEKSKSPVRLASAHNRQQIHNITIKGRKSTSGHRKSDSNHSADGNTSFTKLNPMLT